MLNYRNTLIVSAILLMSLLVADAFMPVSIGLYIGIILASVTLMVWGSVAIRAGYYLRSVCSGDRKISSVALTFDDGPDGQFTPVILDILKEYQVKAAFFIVGKKAERHPEIVQRMHNEGHLIGGHSYSHHFFFDFFLPKTMVLEMKKTANIIYTLTGKKMNLFRPPYGVTNPFVARAIRALHYQSVGWSLKSNDTGMADELLLLNNLTTQVEKGDIILFHDNRSVTAKMLGTFIQFLREKNIAVTRLDTLVNCKAYVN